MSPANLWQLPGDDPYQLNRLADELATRESTGQNNDLDVHDLPAFVPLSHDNAFLADLDFKVEEFLLSRSNNSLPELRSDLREYLSQLKEELVKLINDDYEAFISLSTDLKDEGDRLVRIQSPLADLKLQILQSRTELQAIQNAIREKLEKRAVLREEKALLHLLLKLSDSVTRLETLLLITPPDNESSGITDVKTMSPLSHLDTSDENMESRSRGNRAKHLGRVAAEYVQLSYHSSKARAENCKFVDQLQWRIDRIHSTISSDLDHVFAAALIALTEGKGDGKVAEMEKTKLLSDVMECLRTYDILGLWRDAEDVLRKEVVRAFVKKTIYPGALSAPHSPIVPHTPFPVSKVTSFPSSVPLPPRTPYTPFTALISTRQNSSFSMQPMSTSPFLFLLEDDDEPLARLYNQVLRFVERDLSRIMSIAEMVSIKSVSTSRAEKELGSPSPSTEYISHEFEIMANVIWEEIGRTMIDELGGIIFASGRPNEFRKHYELSQAFIRSLEYLAPSVHSIRAMRAHPIYIAFEQRWQLPVYFQIRWKEIVGSLEESLSVARIDPMTSQDTMAFATSQANAVWVAITACWSAEVFIADLCHKFWRLTLQILSRYKTWLDQNISKHEATLKPSTADKNPSSPSQTRAPTPVQAHESSAETMVVDDATLRQNVALMVDIKALRTHLLTLWREEISMMLPEMSDDEAASGANAQEALHTSLSNLTSLIAPLSNEIVSILTRRCCDALLPVRSIPSQFRAMSNKRTPTEPSYFVASILRPLKLFFGVGVGDGVGVPLEKDYIQPYSTEIFDNVAQRYIYYLAAMKKTEESLRRLKKGKKTTFSLFGSSNAGKDDDCRDEERIRIQMILDVDAFGRDGESLGVVLQNCEAYDTLRDMVQVLEAPESS
ncbi:Conserved oligomeric Golgi complex subunit 2 [Termitomyces sp. T112]|nr:Conserved oligomeric Golgi complex subunit 2 [Termitomyces sp. T112]